MLALRLHLFFLDGLERLPGFLGCAEKIVRRIDRVQVAGSNGRAARLDSFLLGLFVRFARRLLAFLLFGFKFVQPDRSEEHPSELPSLMRISYAVFCL